MVIGFYGFILMNLRNLPAWLDDHFLLVWRLSFYMYLVLQVAAIYSLGKNVFVILPAVGAVLIVVIWPVFFLFVTPLFVLAIATASNSVLAWSAMGRLLNWGPSSSPWDT